MDANFNWSFNEKRQKTLDFQVFCRFEAYFSWISSENRRSDSVWDS